MFAEDRLKFSEQFSLVGGVRYDRPEITKTDYVNAANNFTATPDAVTWRVGAVYNPVPSLALYGQYATAADPVGALVSTSVAQSEFDLSTGRQYEAGIKHLFWGSRGQWTLAGTVASVNASASTVATSSQRSGIDTRASGSGLTE